MRVLPPDFDWICLDDLAVDCILGVYPPERTTPRPVRLQLAVATDIRPAAARDDFRDALNYELIEAAAIRTAVDGRFQLLETLAERVAAAILALSPSIVAVKVRAEKPGALAHTRSVAVEIQRNRETAP